MHYSLRTKILEDSIVRRESRDGQTFIEAEPGDSTRYCLVFTSLVDTASKASCGGTGYVLVNEVADCCRIRSMIVPKDGFVHFNDVEDRMGYGTASAITVAELIAHVVGCKCVTREEFLRDFDATADPIRSTG